MSTLFEIAKDGNLQKIKDAINDGYVLKPIADDAALRWNARLGRFFVVEYLVSLGCDPRSQNDNALRWAARNGHMSVVKFLIKHGCDPRSNNDEALIFSARAGQLNMVEYLIRQKCNPRSRNDEAFILSAANGHMDIMKYLLSYGCNPRSQNDKALLLAYKRRQPSIIQFLIKLGCDPTILPNNRNFKNYLDLVWSPKDLDGFVVKTLDEILNLAPHELVTVIRAILNFHVKDANGYFLSNALKIMQKQVTPTDYVNGRLNKKASDLIDFFLIMLPKHCIFKKDIEEFDSNLFPKYFLKKINSDQNPKKRPRIEESEEIEEPNSSPPIKRSCQIIPISSFETTVNSYKTACGFIENNFVKKLDSMRISKKISEELVLKAVQTYFKDAKDLDKRFLETAKGSN
jgi:ankyrin repeat protein